MGSDKKWIYLSFIVGALLLSWVFDQFLKLVLGYAQISNPIIMGVLPATTVGAVVAMGIFAYFYCRQEKVQVFSGEVLQELRKVTWPSKDGSYKSTIVVLVTVIIMAAILGVFDWICNRLVALILQV